VRAVLTAIQDLLADPNEGSPAQSDAYVLFTQHKTEYRRRVRAEAAKYPGPGGGGGGGGVVV
jgi:ubiquitin-conjugating enzyme E2 I